VRLLVTGAIVLNFPFGQYEHMPSWLEKQPLRILSPLQLPHLLHCGGSIKASPLLKPKRAGSRYSPCWHVSIHWPADTPPQLIIAPFLHNLAHTAQLDCAALTWYLPFGQCKQRSV
jgi:hypothetical protein